MDAKIVVNKILEGADIRKTISEVNVLQEISEEYIKHYSGELGEFDYDTREFVLDDADIVHLYYIGSEMDGSKIKIPTGIVNCQYLFIDCKSLTTPPEIPNGVKDCYSMFYDCTSLKIPPEIPNGVEDCRYMFSGCESLTKAPVIPNEVKIFDYMFDGCSKEVQEAGEWNLEHRGQSYYDQD